METITDYLHSMTSGPGTLRFMLQPLLAVVLGIRDGRLDSHAGEPPIFTAGRKKIGAALKRIVVPLCMAIGLSMLFQFLILRTLHVWTALLFAVLMVALPYLCARGLADRVDRRWHKTHPRHT